MIWLAGEPARLSQLNPAVPRVLDRAVAKTLAKDRKLRDASAAEIRTDLQRLKCDSDTATIATTARRVIGFRSKRCACTPFLASTVRGEKLDARTASISIVVHAVYSFLKTKNARNLIRHGSL